MTCSAEGILIEQAEQSQQITWDQIVKVEQVKAAQTETGLVTSRATYLKMLSTFIGKPLSDSVSLVRPAESDVSGYGQQSS